MDRHALLKGRPAGGALGRNLKRFRGDEDGAMTIFTLFLFIMMLIVGGMAVDFMRFESRRTVLQGAADRCSLAAANLDRVVTNHAAAAAIATDCMTKAGFGEYVIGTPTVAGDSNYRSVEINAQLPMNTFFLKLIDIEKLEAPGNSRAIEGAGNIEISMVLDISGSMKDKTYDDEGNETGETKIEALRTAATTFVNKVLIEDFKNKVSISLIPYSQQVNIGPTLFGRLKTVHRHNFSHCIEISDEEMKLVPFNTLLTYEQSQHVQTNSDTTKSDTGATVYNNDVTQPVCPRYSYERVSYITQDKSALTTQISQLQPRAGTSIFLGLKWGVALLDPSMRTVVAAGLDAGFVGRPFDYSAKASPNPTQKVIVLMTDGQNDWSNYLQSYAYDSPSEYYHWNQFNYPAWRTNQMVNTSPSNHSAFFYNRYKRSDQSLTEYAAYGYPNMTGTIGDTLMQDLCTAAKAKGIVIFAIAFEAPENGQTQMSNCASPGKYYKASGAEIDAIFAAIASQITDLRLTL